MHSAKGGSWDHSGVAQWEIRTGRALDRLINFSDAVIAVAITVLALPLVNIAGPTSDQSILDVLVSNASQISTFVFTFIVMAIMWGVHNRVVNNLRGYDSTIFWLNMAWLLGFAFLPWPSRIYAGYDVAQGNSASINGVGSFYWLTLAYISIMGMLMTFYIRHHRELVDPSRLAFWDSTNTSRARWRPVVYPLVFILAAGLSEFRYWLGYWALILVIPVGMLLRPPRGTASDVDSAEEMERPTL